MPRPTKPQETAEKERASDRIEPQATLERTLKGHTSWVRSMSISPDGRWVVSGSDDTSIRVWNLDSGNCSAVLKGHRHYVNAIALSPDGTKVLSASNDRTLRIWDSGSGHLLHTCEGHETEVCSVIALADGRRAFSGAWDGSLRMWDIESGAGLLTIRNTMGVTSLAVTLDNKQILSGHQDGSIKLWDAESGASLGIFKGHTLTVGALLLDPDGQHIFSASHDGTVRIWDLHSGACTTTLEDHGHSVALSPDGRWLASDAIHGNSVSLWDWKRGRRFQPIQGLGTATLACMTFNADGTRLLLGTAHPHCAVNVYHLTMKLAAATVTASRRYTNAKVVLVGESGVGKSGLAHRLIEDRFVETPSTHGMQVWRLDLPEKPHDPLEREALLWDLAGQEDYRLIHQLFLDDTALALMLFDPQSHDPFAEVETWLKVLNSALTPERAKEVVKVLVAARIDTGNVKVSRAKIDRFVVQHGLAGYLATSAKRGDACSDSLAADGLSELKALIAQHLPWTKLPWTSTPRLLAELKNAVIALSEQREVRLLRFPELAHRLRPLLPEEQFEESDVRTAVALLANHGVVLPLKFGDLVLLQPSLLNGYASAVIRAARDHTDEIGCVAEQDVFDRKIDFEGVERLEPADEELLMRALVQTLLDKSLCIAEPSPEGRHLIFPSQYRRERPIPAHPEVYVSYTFTGEWQTVYTTLVVRLWYSQELKHRELWQNAAEFETTKGHRLGLVIARTGEGQGTISVFFDPEVPDELKVVFIEYIHRHLGKYAREVRRDRRYVCACGEPVRDLEAVRKRIDAKRDFITCQVCDARVVLIDHIEQRLHSDPVARRVLGMDQKATEALDTQALDQILIGHMLAICGEANQIFRQLTQFDYGIDGEVEFKSRSGEATGRKIYVQLKSGDSHLRLRKSDGHEIFDVKNPRHLEYWASQPADVYLVIRDSEGTIRWMNLTRYLKERKGKKNLQIIFTGEKLDADAVRRLRDQVV